MEVDLVSMIAFVPLVAIAGGALAGLAMVWYLGMRKFLWLLGLVGLVALLLIVRLAVIGPGEETDAFVPFVMLTGGLLPALFGVIMGGVAGRALARRNGRT